MELQNAPRMERDVPIAFMVTWGGVSTIALGGGALLGFRAFEDTAAFEALDKLEKPTPAAEKQAARMAARAFGWGTAAAVGSTAFLVLAARWLGVRTAADVGVAAKAALAPFDAWLQRSGDGALAVGKGANRALDGLCDATAERWRASWLGSALKGRVERVAAHHEAKEMEKAA
jgi:hypothetical protein